MKESLYFVIRCLLSADAETRRKMWLLMQKYTLLVNKLLEVIPGSSEFPVWREQGYIPDNALAEFIDTIKPDLDYSGLPGRFYTSAKILVKNIYKSWFTLQRKYSRKITRKIRWIKIINSEIDLIKNTEFELDQITNAANAALKLAKKKKEECEKSNSDSSKSLLGILIEMQFKTKSPLKKRGINHLLLNNLNIEYKDFMLDSLEARVEVAFLEIEALEKRLRSRLPKGRDPDGYRYILALSEAASLPEEALTPEKFDEIHADIPIYNEFPYPLIYEGASNIVWTLVKPKGNGGNFGRLQVHFNGISELKFLIQCGRRQLPVFKGFYDDAIENKGRISRGEIPFNEGLNRFRSAQILWKPDPSLDFRKKEKNIPSSPWEVNRLSLHCSVDKATLSAEGTECLRQMKIKKIEEKKEKPLSPRKQTELERLRSAAPPPRPSIQPYVGNPNIVICVCFSPDEPVIVVPVDLAKEAALYALNTKALLNRATKAVWRMGKLETLSDNGKALCHDNGGKLNIRNPGTYSVQKPYGLVTRLNTLSEQQVKRRTREQSKGKYRGSQSLSNLSLSVCRLIAARLVDLSLQLDAGRVIIPDFEGIRDWVQAFIAAKAVKAFPDSKQQQKKFRQEFRAKYHRWGYRKLAQEIERCARTAGLEVVCTKQPSLYSIIEQANQTLEGQEFHLFKLVALKMALPKEM